MKARPKRVGALHFYTQDPDLDRLLKPGSAYRVPTDVVNDTGLSLVEKKAILASWASDACAVENRPGVRHPPMLTDPVSFDAIMSALQELDRQYTTSTKDPASPDGGRHSSPVC